MRVRTLLASAALAVAAGSLTTAQRQQASTTVYITVFGARPMTVTESGRDIGATNERIALSPGRHDLEVGSRPACVFLELGASGQIAIADTSVTVTGRGALDCAKIWSEVRIEFVPGDVTVTLGGAVAERRGRTVIARVPRPPTSIRIETRGGPYAAVDTSVGIGAEEIATYRLALAPGRPDVLADTVLTPIPPEPPLPPKPAPLTTPPDPSPSLAEAEQRLELVHQARGDYHMSVFMGVVAAASLSYAVIRDLDSLTPWPQRRSSVLIPFWSGTITGLMSVAGFGGSSNRKRQAGCTTSLTACEQADESEINRLQQAKADYPNAVHAAELERAQRQAAYERAVADHGRVRSQWADSVRAIEQVNQRIRVNQQENERRERAWRSKVAAAGVVLVSREKRP